MPVTLEVDDEGRSWVGKTEAYICRACGYTEYYTRFPDKIPVHPVVSTELSP